MLKMNQVICIHITAIMPDRFDEVEKNQNCSLINRLRGVAFMRANNVHKSQLPSRDAASRVRITPEEATILCDVYEYPIDTITGLLAGDDQPLAGDDQPLAGDGQPLADDGQPLADDGQPLADDGQPLAGDGQPLAGDGQPLAGDDQPLAGDGQPLAGDDQPLAGDDQPLAGDGQPRADFLRPLPSSSAATMVAGCGDIGAAKYLIAQGLDFTAKDDLGMAPTEVAARMGQVEMVRYLLRAAPVEADYINLDSLLSSLVLDLRTDVCP